MDTPYFGLGRKPLTDSAAQVFLTIPSYQAAYDWLRHQLTEPERRGLLLLTGVAGAGKTTLLHRLIADLTEQAHWIFVWNTHLGFDDLLDYLGDDLDLRRPGAGRNEKLQTLETALSSRLAEGGKVILVLDDAQNLPDETLEGLQQLLRWEGAGQPLLPIVLSGQPALETRIMETPGLSCLNGGTDRHYRLNALDDNEAKLYIKERLRTAGYSDEDLFERNALQEVIAQAQGIARLINLICDRARLLAYLNAERRLSAERVREAAAAGTQLDWSPAAPSMVSRPAMPVCPPKRRVFIPLDRRWHSLAAGLLVLAMLAPPALRSKLGLEPERFPWGVSGASQTALKQNMPAVPPAFPPTQAAGPAAIEESLSLKESAAVQRPSPTDPNRARARRIQTLLDQARQRMAALRYTRPAGQSALDSYRKVLRLDPRNAGAKQGIQRIKSSFVQWADSARARGDLPKARRYLETALAIEPGDAAVKAHLTRVRREQAMRASRSRPTHYDKGYFREGWVNRD